MQLNYFTVSHDIIFLFGSSGDIKLSFGAKVDFTGWVVLFCVAMLADPFLGDSEEALRQAGPDFFFLHEEVKSNIRLDSVTSPKLKIQANNFFF